MFCPDAEPSRKERGHRGVRPRHPSRSAKSEPGRVPQAARDRVVFVQTRRKQPAPPLRYNLRMRSSRSSRLTVALLACALLSACGSTAPADVSTPTARLDAIPTAHVAAQRLLDWPEFGLNPQRTDSSEGATGITSANVSHLRRVQLTLGGTVDSSPIYLHGASVGGAPHNVVVVTTTYGKTLAIDADSGRTLWTFTPPGLSRWAGSSQITTTSPSADPNRKFVYTASPNGLIHKLSLSDGREASTGSWPVSVTRDATHEKLGAALNIDGPDIVVATSGYFGDAPPYQGHVVLIDRASGRMRGVFNTLCSNRRGLIVPSSCPASDSAVLSRSGVVVESGGGRLLLDTGNGPWNGSTNFGDSVLELTFPSLTLRQSFTPTNQESLNTSDTDLGSSAPALLGENRIMLAGKDGIMRVLELSRLNGRSSASHTELGGELQRLQIPGGGQLFTAPAVWRHSGHTTMFVADENGTAAYVLRRGRLYQAWQNGTPGTSPVMAGGLLYVYDPSAGGIYVYRPGSPRPIAKLPGASGHWNSPIVVHGHVIEPEGNGNDHKLTGTLEIFSVG
jgi:PQQ-like domain